MLSVTTEMNQATTGVVHSVCTWSSGLQLPPANLTWAAVITEYVADVADAGAEDAEPSPLSSLNNNRKLFKTSNYHILCTRTKLDAAMKGCILNQIHRTNQYALYQW